MEEKSANAVGPDKNICEAEEDYMLIRLKTGEEIWATRSMAEKIVS